MKNRQPLFIINSVAPIRVCDNGGWTDTWFAGHGRIFNIGVYPYAEVQIKVFPDGGDQDRIVINAENYGERYERHLNTDWEHHPLLEAAIERVVVPSVSVADEDQLQETLQAVEEAHKRINAAIKRNERTGWRAKVDELAEEAESPAD